MPENITCPQCGRELRVPETLLGKKVKCPGCATTFTAPAPGAALPGEGEGPPEPAPAAAGGEPAPSAPAPAGGPPKEVGLIANFALFGGIWACVLPLCCCLSNLVPRWATGDHFPLDYLCCFVTHIYVIVVGVLSILTGLKLRRPDAYLQPPPTLNAILRIVAILGGDLVNAILGGITLYWLKSKPEVMAYYQGGGAARASEPPAQA
jgi:hypothetical protein